VAYRQRVPGFHCLNLTCPPFGHRPTRLQIIKHKCRHFQAQHSLNCPYCCTLYRTLRFEAVPSHKNKPCRLTERACQAKWWNFVPENRSRVSTRPTAFAYSALHQRTPPFTPPLALASLHARQSRHCCEPLIITTVGLSTLCARRYWGTLVWFRLRTKRGREEVSKRPTGGQDRRRRS